MAGVQLELTLQGMEEAVAALTRLASTDLEDLANNIGQILRDGTQARIAEEKRAPDGAAWAPWSPRHARTREARHSLLVQDNFLQVSIDNYTTGTTVRVGTNLVYGAIHQFGGTITNGFGRGISITIPARPYLGLSDGDRAAVAALVTDTLERRLQ